jgi:hypothetical protein
VAQDAIGALRLDRRHQGDEGVEQRIVVCPGIAPGTITPMARAAYWTPWAGRVRVAARSAGSQRLVRQKRINYQFCRQFCFLIPM